ncbi:MAG: hypothetical protein K9G76_00060 [Bacteroidales bacterium]|nr:hypothetical protein [Bacteroidales bacterium]MCF8402504.1 hypothetical protein [Bacteroidales bacterium]
MSRKTLISIAFFAITTLILIIPSLYNGYPIVHQDSGHYLKTSRSLQTYAITPIGYSLFIRAVTWQTAVWMIVVVQALILNFFLFFSLKELLSKKEINYRLVHIIIISLLSIFSGMGWYVNRIMPDIFTAYAILSVYFFIRKDSKLITRIISGIFIFWASISHFSNIYVILLLFVFIFIFYLTNRKYRSQYHLLSLSLILPILILSNIAIRGYNYYTNNGFVTAKYKHGAIMAKFVEYGILEDYLKTACIDHNFSLCEYQGKFPNTTGGFIWNENSPFNKFKYWQEVEEEYNFITQEIISKPKYIYTYFAKSIYSSAKQFFRISIVAVPKLSGSGPFIAIENGFPIDFQSYKSTLQYWDKLSLTLVNQIYYLLYSLSILYLILLIFMGKINPLERIFYLVIIMGAISNAIVFGTLATVIDRFQSRIGWILIFLALAIFFDRNYHQLKNFYLKYRQG